MEIEIVEEPSIFFLGFMQYRDWHLTLNLEKVERQETNWNYLANSASRVAIVKVKCLSSDEFTCEKE